MKKILILGNSHVASLKTAYSQLSSSTMHFISRSMGRGGLSGIGLDRTELTGVGENLGFKFYPNNKDFLSLSEYDAIVLVGLPVSIFDYRIFSHHFLSALAKEYFCSDRNQFSSLINKFKGSGLNNRVLIVEKPFPIKSGRILAYKEYLDGVEYFNKNFLNEHGLSIVPQPEETTSGHLCLTDSKFLASSDDLKHMNAEYGAKVLLCLNEAI